jgi:hypothetical protein
LKNRSCWIRNLSSAMISNSRNSCRLCDHYTRTNLGTHFCKQAGRLSPKCNAKLTTAPQIQITRRKALLISIKCNAVEIILQKLAKNFNEYTHPNTNTRTDCKIPSSKETQKEDLSTQISRATNESCSTINTKIVPCLDSISLPFSAHPIIVAKERTNTSYHLKAHCKELST